MIKPRLVKCINGVFWSCYTPPKKKTGGYFYGFTPKEAYDRWYAFYLTFGAV